MKRKFFGMIFIFIAIFLFILNACQNDKSGDQDNPPKTEKSSGSAEETEPAAKIQELPVKDFEGYEFKLLWPEVIAGNHFIHNELWAENESGEPINDAVYARNLAVEESYNIKTSCAVRSFSEIPNIISRMISAGDDSYDAFCTQIAQISPLALKGILADFGEMAYFDPDMPWWNASTMDALSVAGKQYFGTGDIIFSDDLYAYLVMCNLELIKNYGLENPYELVRSGKWTVDKMIDMAKNASADLNNDEKYSWEDQYGIALVNSGSRAFFHGSGMSITEKDSEGMPYLVMNSEKTQSVLEKILQVYYTDNITLNGNKNTAPGIDHANTVEKCFTENRSIFLVMTLISVERIRASEVSLGLLPIPKYDEAQKDYVCILGDMTLLGVPSNAPDPGRTSLLLSAMSQKSVSTVTPAFYKIVLTEKYLRDEDSVEMLELIMHTAKVPDLGTIYDYGSLNSGFVNLVAKNENNFASFYEANEAKALADIENMKAALQ